MNDTNWLVLLGIVVVGVAVVFLLDAGPAGPVLAPVADAGFDVVLNECAIIRVGCEGYDPAGGAVSYLWTAPRGSFDNARVLRPLYSAPAVCGFGEDVVLTLTVTNEHGIIARDTLVVHVRDTALCAFTAICPATIPCMTSVIAPSRPVIWRTHVVPMPVCAPVHVLPMPMPVCAPVHVLPMPMPVCAPVHVLPQPMPVCAPTHVVPLPVPVCAPVPVPLVHHPVTTICAPQPVVLPCPVPCAVPCSACPQPLLVQACMPVSPAPCPIQSVVEGGSIQLRGTVWDPDCNLAHFFWSADKGTFSDRSSLNPIYFAPMTANPNGEDVCIMLTAVDRCGATTVSRIMLHIRDTNQPPVVGAGRDLTVGACSSIQLAGSASDPNGDRMTYHWSAECGRGQFSNPNILCPVYTAPSSVACEGEIITLTLMVTDEHGARSWDSMIVHVRSGNVPPIVQTSP